MRLGYIPELHAVQLNGDIVRAIIKDRGYTLSSLSTHMGRGSGFVSHLLTQYGGAVQIRNARELADALNVPLTAIIDTVYLNYLRRKGRIRDERKHVQLHRGTESFP